MRNLLVVSLLILLFCSAAMASESQFRNTGWEMSKKQVIAAEEVPLTLETHKDKKLQRLETLKGETKIYGFDCRLSYIFVDDKLAVGMYTITPTYDDPNQYIKDYRKIEQILKGEFGPAAPSNRSFENIQDPYKKDPGAAVKAGALLFQTHREIPLGKAKTPTRIVHMLATTQGISHRVVYSHPELSQLQTDIIRESQK